MSDQYRRERIERLLHELRYEITRGVMEREVDERMVHRFFVPISREVPGGIVVCELKMTPTKKSDAITYTPMLSVVGSAQWGAR